MKAYSAIENIVPISSFRAEKIAALTLVHLPMTTSDSFASYPRKFTSSFLPSATSFGSSSRAFQSNFPNSTSKPLIVN